LIYIHLLSVEFCNIAWQPATYSYAMFTPGRCGKSVVEWAEG